MQVVLSFILSWEEHKECQKDRSNPAKRFIRAARCARQVDRQLNGLPQRARLSSATWEHSLICIFSAVQVPAEELSEYRSKDRLTRSELRCFT